VIVYCVLSNPYDGHTLDDALAQYRRLTGHDPVSVTADRGYRGRSVVGRTRIHTPKPFNKNKLSRSEQVGLRKSFRRRAAIEPVIGHLKSDHRLSRNYLKGEFGDAVNVMLAAAGFNFRRMMNRFREFLRAFFLFLFTSPNRSNEQTLEYCFA